MSSRVSMVRLMSRSTTARTYDAIEVVIDDLHLACDIVDDRDIRLARRLADAHGAHFYVAEHLRARAAKALGEGV